MSGADNPRGQNFNVNRNHLSLRSFATSLKKISFKSDFIHFFFIILYMYIAPGQGLTTLGDEILMSTEHLVTSVISCKFKKNLFEV